MISTIYPWHGQESIADCVIICLPLLSCDLPRPSLLIGLDEPPDRAVISLLHVIGEQAGRQLA